MGVGHTLVSAARNEQAGCDSTKILSLQIPFCREGTLQEWQKLRLVPFKNLPKTGVLGIDPGTPGMGIGREKREREKEEHKKADGKG